MTGRDLIANLDEVPLGTLDALDGTLHYCADRAVAAGARAPLAYVGAGASAIVFASGNLAYKVARYTGRHVLVDEHDWLMSARHQPTRAHVAFPLTYDDEREVIVREYVVGRPGGWSQDVKLRKVYEEIRAAMRAVNWGMPEFKEDSFVLEDGTGRVVLVDASSPIRFGVRYLEHVEAVLAGAAPRTESNSDMAWALRMELDRMPVAAALRAERLLARLATP